MPYLTGIRSSGQWPIGISVLFTICWLVAFREGVRIPALIANGLGDAVGLLISKVFMAAMITKPKTDLFWLTSFIIIAPLAVLFTWSLRQERKALEYVQEIDEDFKAIEALPVDERLSALDARIEGLLAEVEAHEKRNKRLQPLIVCSVSLGAVLLGSSLIQEFRRGPRLVSTMIDLSGLVLCVGYLIWLVYNAVLERKLKDESRNESPEL